MVTVHLKLLPTLRKSLLNIVVNLIGKINMIFIFGDMVKKVILKQLLVVNHVLN